MSEHRPAPPCANQTDAAAICRADAPPPTPPRRTHRIPRRSAPWPQHSSDAGVQPRPGYRPGLVALKRQLYGQSYVRTDPPKSVRILRLKSCVTRWEQRTAYGGISIPQNVNFAIGTPIISNFLEAKGISLKFA